MVCCPTVAVFQPDLKGHPLFLTPDNVLMVYKVFQMIVLSESQHFPVHRVALITAGLYDSLYTEPVT